MKKLLPLLGFLLVVAALYLLVRQPAQVGIKGTPADLNIEAPTLFAEFLEDESGANEKYLNKTMVITGTIKDATNNGAVMPTLQLETNSPKGTVYCIFDIQSEHARHEFHIGEQVSIKGVCMDYYRNVKLVNCVEM